MHFKYLLLGGVEGSKGERPSVEELIGTLLTCNKKFLFYIRKTETGRSALVEDNAQWGFQNGKGKKRNDQRPLSVVPSFSLFFN